MFSVFLLLTTIKQIIYVYTSLMQLVWYASNEDTYVILMIPSSANESAEYWKLNVSPARVKFIINMLI